MARAFSVQLRGGNMSVTLLVFMNQMSSVHACKSVNHYHKR